jgi:hypothetical protein
MQQGDLTSKTHEMKEVKIKAKRIVPEKINNLPDYKKIFIVASICVIVLYFILNK